MTKSNLKLVTSAIVNRTVVPTRPPNTDLRTREYLTETEVERLMTAALNCGRCGDFRGSRSRSRLSCSPRNAARRSRPQASPAWSNAQAQRRGLAFKAHPHMLRHACGYALASRGHDTRALQAYLGHRNIQHTVRKVKHRSRTRGHF